MKLSRRDFIKASVASSVVFVSAGLQSCASNDDDVSVAFDHGVASGDPLTDSVVLWTRVTPQAAKSDVTVMWEVARDAAFTDLVNMDQGVTSAARDYTVKVDVRGLAPDTRYYYRFSVGDAVSPVGQTKTLPEGSPEQVTFVAFSCSNYPAGYFNVYRQAAQEADVDAALHLGDYIYEYAREGYASEQAEALGRQVNPDAECITLEDYRTRYAQYRTDPDLQNLHAVLPWIVVWDDHEIANDAWEFGAENHDEGEGSYETRKQVSLQAYFEWMPIRPLEPDADGRIYRQFVYGDLVNLLMLDTRRIGRDEQLDYANYIDDEGNVDVNGFLVDVSSDQRTILGTEQRDWLVANMTTSQQRWQVLGQQVLMGRMLLPAVTLTPDPFDPLVTLEEYSAIAVAALKYQLVLEQLAAQGITEPTVEQLLAAGMTEDELAIVNDPEQLAVLQSPNIPYNLDAWDGYAFDREMVLGTALAQQKNLITLAGDTHNGWSSQLTTADGTPAGVEFATASVSSPGLETFLGLEEPTAARQSEAGLVQLINDLRYCNLRERGYLVVTFTPDSTVGKWVYIDTVTSRSYQVIDDLTTVLEVSAGNPEVTPA